MAHYFLHIYDAQGEAVDLLGVDLPDLRAARDEAFGLIRSLFLDQGEVKLVNFTGRIEVVEGYNASADLIVPFHYAASALVEAVSH